MTLDMLDDREAVARFLANLRCYDEKNIVRALVHGMNCSQDEAERLARTAIANVKKEG